MIPLDQAFARAGTAFICYLTYGFPDRKTHLELVKEISCYCDVLEVGLPYSDPVADGPVIQEAHLVALAQGLNADDMFEDYSSLNLDCAAVVMGYAGSIYRYGIERFSRKASEAGFGGVVIPDIPYEEHGLFKKQAHLPLISFISPTTPEERLTVIAEKAEGFIYVITSLGVTGMRQEFDKQLIEILTRVKRRSRVPVCAGFGVSTPEQAARVAEFADGVIVGSAIIKQIRENPDSLGNFLNGLMEAIHGQQ